MVPDKFNMVDMEGIDIITSQGEAIPGLYQKLVESIAQCRYQCIYNWKFNGILIPPTYVEMTIIDDVVWINEGVSVDEEDVIRIYSLEPPVPEPRLLALAVSANGDYLPPAEYDGFSSVNVAVPEPVFGTIIITENGYYTPEQGVDGFLGVTVNVPNTGSTTYEGTSKPPSNLGSNGDWYIQNLPSCRINSLGIDTGINGTNVYGFEYIFTPISSLHTYQSYLVSVLDNFTVGQGGSLGRIYLRIRGSEKLSFTSSEQIDIEAKDGVISTSTGNSNTYDGTQPLCSSSGNIFIGALSSDRYSDFAFVSLTLYDSNSDIIDSFYYDELTNTIKGSLGSLPQSGTGSITSYAQSGIKKAYHKENGIWVEY